MLVLTRKPGEGILIGDNIEIKITKVQGQCVHVGISAPLDISILRTELAARKGPAKSSICPHGVDKRRPCYQCRTELVDGGIDGNR